MEESSPWSSGSFPPEGECARDVGYHCGLRPQDWIQEICVDRTVEACVGTWLNGLPGTTSTRNWSFEVSGEFIGLGVGESVSVTFGPREGLKSACTGLASQRALNCAIELSDCNKENECSTPQRQALVGVPYTQSLEDILGIPQATDQITMQATDQITISDEPREGETKLEFRNRLETIRLYRDFERVAQLSPSLSKTVRRILFEAQQDTIRSDKISLVAQQQATRAKNTRMQLSRQLRKLLPTVQSPEPPILNARFSAIDAIMRIRLAKVLSDFQYAQFHQRFPFWAFPFGISQPFTAVQNPKDIPAAGLEPAQNR